MSSPCPIFLINLPGSHARLQDAERQFRGAWLEFERIEAVDGRKLPPDELARLAPDNRGAFYHRLTPGEIGCYLSHLRAVRTIVDRALPAAVVFEDDFLLQPGFTACVRELLALGDRLPDLVKLYGARRRGEPRHTLPCGVRLMRSSSPPICSTCTLWTLKGARKFLDGGDRMVRPVDVQLKHWWEQDLDILWASPPLVVDSPVHTPASTIGSRRVTGIRGHAQQASYRWGYALQREARYLAGHGLAAWARSFTRVPRDGRRMP
jgi:glycosyl transferase family 25